MTATAVKSANSRLRVLSARVLSIQEEERRHISRDLHDDVGQSVAALKFCLHRLAPLSKGPAAALVSECITLADATLERIRQLSRAMHPPELDALGLEEALRALVEGLRAATGLDMKCHFNGLLSRRFAPEVESAAYRIAQEALGNATRHARASSILLTVEGSAGGLVVTVRDDGTGFEPGRLQQAEARGRLGVSSSIKGRARDLGGSATVTSAPGSGTVVSIEVPISREVR